MLAVSLGDWELENSGSREKPFLPATVLSRLKIAWGFERGDRLLQVALEMSLGECPPSIPHSQLRFLRPPCFRGMAKTTEGNGGFGCI